MVAASGGFESNLDWLKRRLGTRRPTTSSFAARRTTWARCCGLLLDAGREVDRRPDAVPRVAIDARSPKFDGGIVTRVDCVSLGIVVNRHAQRFYDEGEDFWPKRYAIWGRLVAGQPDQIAYSIIDSKADRQVHAAGVRAGEGGARSASSARSLELDPAALEATVDRFNAAVRPGTFDHAALDDCATEGIDAAQDALGAPDRHAPVLRLPAAARHHLHLSRRRRSTRRARMLMQDGKPAANIFAAGEIMAGNVLGKGYLAGYRHDDRNGVRTDRRRGGGAQCRELERQSPGKAAVFPTTGRTRERCHLVPEPRCSRRPNSTCRSAMPAATAKGYCAVFPAMERRLTFAEADLHYLANLCHDCGACYYACQYAPPHEFDVNIPRNFAQIRAQTYKRYAWPGFLAVLFERNGVVVSLATALGLALFLLVTFYYAGAGGAVRGASGRRLLHGHPAWRDGLDVRARLTVRAAGARDRFRPVLARDGRADPRVRAAGGARARVARCVAPEEPHGRRRRLSPTRTSVRHTAAGIPSSDVLRLHALLRRDVRGDDLSLRLRLGRAICLHEPAGDTRHGGRTRTVVRPRGAAVAQIEARSRHRRAGAGPGWMRGFSSCCCSRV